jgi:acyl-CoA thioester hydrolase
VVPQVSDTDYGRGVYHGRYFALYNQARDRFLADLGVSYPDLMKQDMHLTVAQLTCKYIKPVFYNENIQVLSKVTWLRSRSLGVFQQMVLEGDPETGPVTKNEVEFSLVCVNSNGKAVCLPLDLVQAIEAFQSGDV